MKKRLLALALAACSFLPMCACNNTPVKKPDHLGLYVNEDGTMMKDGKEFYGIGINYYSLINGSSKIGRTYDMTQPLETLELFKEYGVKVVRFNLGFYNSKEWSDFICTVDKNNQLIVDSERTAEAKHFEALDKVVAKAEELGIGLIPSFAWNSPAISDVFDEPCNKAFASDETATMTWFLGFVARVVKRYADSPAIYGWEYGNEQNLITRPRAGSHTIDYLSEMDRNQPLPGWSQRKERTEEDVLTYKTHSKALELFAEVVDANDPYHRMIGSGDADQRRCAYNWSIDKEKIDTKEEFEKAIDMIVPGKMSAISMHEYASTQLAGLQGNVYDYLEGGDSVQAKNFTEYLTSYKMQSARTSKAAYLGETGYVWRPNSAIDVTVRTEEHCIKVIEAICEAAYTTDFPLIMLWNYDPKTKYDPNDHAKFDGGTDVSWNVQFKKGKGYMEAIKKYNELIDEKHSGNAESEA